MSRAIISLHLGQCGVHLGSSTWELFAAESGINRAGKINKRCVDSVPPGMLFEEVSNGKYVPRTVFIDTEPGVIDEIRTGSYRDLYRPDNLIASKEDASSVFARGYYTLASEMIDHIMDHVRKQVEKCSSLQGFMLYRSYGGGTGSGLGSAVCAGLRDDYVKMTQIELAIVPSGRFSSSTVEPYNGVLASHESLENSDCSVFFENDALYDLLTNNLHVQRPTFQDINRLVAQIVSSITCPLRTEDDMSLDIAELQTNLVPYPRVHFPIVSAAPLIPRYVRLDKDVGSGEITKMLFNKSHFSIKCCPVGGKFISCCIAYRGALVSCDIQKAINHIKRQCSSIQFVAWCKTGFKISLAKSRPKVPRQFPAEFSELSASMICNSTVMGLTFGRLNHKFDLLKSKRSFIHHYVSEGMPEEDFSNFRDDLAALEMDYEEMAKDALE